jgi:hypothetical protein
VTTHREPLFAFDIRAGVEGSHLAVFDGSTWPRGRTLWDGASRSDGSGAEAPDEASTVQGRRPLGGSE